MTVLTAIDVLGIQRFIFSSNRLQDIVAGSWMVHWSTSPDEAMKGLVPVEKVLFAGGGNAILEFNSIEKAHEFTARYTRRLYDEAPGLEVAVVHKPIDKGELIRALQEIQIELARTKAEHFPASPLLGLSVTTSCQETGVQATGFDEKKSTVPLSKGVLKRRSRISSAKAHWFEYLKDRTDLAFPMELDFLGRTINDTSLIGVVHVDGNGVGRKIKQWLSEKSKKEADDNAVRQEYREWSQAIDKLGKAAFQAVVDRVWQATVKSYGEGKESIMITGHPARLGFVLKEGGGEWMLPLRPILLGGDDLTFVCDGRIALDLAETALSVFKKSNVPHLGKITACAGVAIVRVHSPIARAYELAEKLCVSAKQMLHRKNLSDCAIDWHSGTPRPSEAISSIRERQYLANNYLLTCRPFPLGTGKDEMETWSWLSKMLLDDSEVGLRGGQWSKRRNKVKSFSRLVREGPEGVKSALLAWRIVDDKLKLPKGIEQDGFISKNRTPLPDALDLLDLHLVLEPGGNIAEKQEEKP